MGKAKMERRLADNEAQAHARFVRTSPQKLNLLAQQIRGLTADAALAALTFSKRRAANDVKKLLQSAVANAENNHQLDVDRLYVKAATVGKTVVLKRSARGRATGRPHPQAGQQPDDYRSGTRGDGIMGQKVNPIGFRLGSIGLGLPLVRRQGIRHASA